MESPSEVGAGTARLLLVVGAAHALVALAGMAVAVRAHVDGLEFADVLRAVMAAGGHGTMNGLVHDNSLLKFVFERLLDAIVSGLCRIMLPDNFTWAALQTGTIAAIMKEAFLMRILTNEGDFCLWNIRRWAKPA